MTELEETFSLVLSEDPVGYGGRALPCPMDQALNLLLDAYSRAQPADRRLLSAQPVDILRRLLLVFAERMASLAVRQSSPLDLFHGLAALAVVESWAVEPRESVAILSLLHDAAIRIGLSPRSAFAEALTNGTEVAAQSFTRFLARDQRDKTIEAMGYSVGADGGGFRYERTW